MQENSSNSNVIEVDTLIIGGGVAGIAAARELESKRTDSSEKASKGNASWIMLEASDRLGGRTHTVSGNDDGAAWLHFDPENQDNPLRHLARKTGVTLVKEEENVQIYWNGERIEETAFRRIVDAAYEKMSRYVRDAGKPDCSIATLLSPRPGSLEEKVYIAEFGGAESNFDLSQVSVRDFMATRPRTCGYLVKEGLGTLFERYAATLPQEKIRLNSEVTRVKWARPGTGLPAEVSVGDTLYRAKNVIVTLPVGVLQEKLRLEDPPFFNPPLPSEKQVPITHLRMGLMNKVHLPLVSPDFFTQQGIGPNTHLHLYDGNEARFYLAHVNGKASLTLLVGGSTAERLENGGRQAAVAYALEGLTRQYGDAFLQAVDRERIAVTEWGKDDYARGAYTGGGVWLRMARKALAKPCGNLFWAGEACWQNGWETHVTGAYFSGVEAARAAWQQLHSEPSITAGAVMCR